MTINGTLTPTARRVTIPTWVCKVVMAITGLIMAAFVFIHMVGNVKILTDPAQMDHYAQWLRTIGEPALPYGSVLDPARDLTVVCSAAYLWRTHLVAPRRVDPHARCAQAEASRLGCKAHASDRTCPHCLYRDPYP